MQFISFKRSIDRRSGSQIITSTWCIYFYAPLGVAVLSPRQVFTSVTSPCWVCLTPEGHMVLDRYGGCMSFPLFIEDVGYLYSLYNPAK